MVLKCLTSDWLLVAKEENSNHAVVVHFTFLLAMSELLYILAFLNLSVLLGMEWYLMVVSICTCLMTKGVGYPSSYSDIARAKSLTPLSL